MIIPYETDFFPPTRNIIEALGRKIFLTLRGAGRALKMIFQAHLCIAVFFKSRDEIRRQMLLAGIQSFAITSIVGLFTGMILALQTGLLLRDYGQEAQIGNLVAQTLCREMGPFMTSLILAASVGSAITAQIGTMAVSEELAALEVMSINPVRFLVMPRLIALMLMCPILTIYTNVIGTVGGGIVASNQIDVPWGIYFDSALRYLKNKDIMVGIFKSYVFGVLIVTISCYKGMATTGGAAGVGNATRSSVITSFLMILLVGYFITRMFY